MSTPVIPTSAIKDGLFLCSVCDDSLVYLHSVSGAPTYECLNCGVINDRPDILEHRKLGTLFVLGRPPREKS